MKSETHRSTVIVAVLCASFLWWWFTLDPTPEVVGPLGLVERALIDEQQETPATAAQRPVVLDFDLLELAMGYLRAGKFSEATRLAANLQAPGLQARGLRAIATGHLAQSSGAMGEALEVLGKITDSALRETAREQVLGEISRLGFADVAWEQQPSLPLQLSILRNMAESDAQPEARRRLNVLEPAALASGSPGLMAELTWTHLALHNVERVLALLPQLPEPMQDEIYLDLFRMMRLEDPTQARPTLERLPARLQWRARIEAANLGGTLETPAALVAELTSATTDTAADLRLLTQAQATLHQPTAEAWQATAQRLEKLPPSLPNDTTLWLAQLYYDALDQVNGHRLLELARAQTLRLPTTAERIPPLAALLAAAFRNAETSYVQQLLLDLEPVLADLPSPLPDALGTPVREICAAEFRDGQWPRVFALLPKLPPHFQTKVLADWADLVVEASASQGFAIAQDQSQAQLRSIATTQGESEATKLAMRQKSPLARARAWLEIAKGLVLKQLLEAEAPEGGARLPPSPS